ncbi:hypothetical protein BgiMline_020697 [Biomphalaria glabrata]|nr:hypothetical protein BgiMline_017889 [Biomphalaria glabrata]
MLAVDGICDMLKPITPSQVLLHHYERKGPPLGSCSSRPGVPKEYSNEISLKSSAQISSKIHMVYCTDIKQDSRGLLYRYEFRFTWSTVQISSKIHVVYCTDINKIHVVYCTDINLDSRGLLYRYQSTFTWSTVQISI